MFTEDNFVATIVRIFILIMRKSGITHWHFITNTQIHICGDDAIIAGIYNNMSVKSLINMDKDEYENYIEHAINVIKWRTKKIE